MARIKKIKVNNTAYDVGPDFGDKGSATNPVYFKSGEPVACTYSLNKTVPSDAKFTDTTYNAATTSTAGLLSASDKAKLDGIAAGAQVNSVTGVKGNSESSYRTGNVNITAANIGLGNVSNTSDANKPVSTAQQAAIDSALDSAKSYADGKVANLVNNSTAAVDSITELAKAMEDNADAIEALENIAGSKASASDLTAHTGNKSNPHSVTAAQVGAYTKTEVDAKIPTIDSSLSTTSTNPVQNKVITNWLGQNVKDYALQEAYYAGDLNSSDWYLTLASSGVSAAASEPSDGNSQPQYGNRLRWIQTSDGKFHKITAAVDHSGEVIVSDTYGYLTGSGVQSYTLNYLKNVTSDIQSQLNGKSNSGHTHSSYVNQNAFAKVKVNDSTTIEADDVSDTLNLVAGSNITITSDAANDKITIAATDTTYSAISIDYINGMFTPLSEPVPV